MPPPLNHGVSEPFTIRNLLGFRNISSQDNTNARAEES